MSPSGYLNDTAKDILNNAAVSAAPSPEDSIDAVVIMNKSFADLSLVRTPLLQP